jgi:hypothetical protein
MSGGILHTMAARENIGPVVDDAFREQKTEGQFLIVFCRPQAGCSHHHGQGARLLTGITKNGRLFLKTN